MYVLASGNLKPRGSTRGSLLTHKDLCPVPGLKEVCCEAARLAKAAAMVIRPSILTINNLAAEMQNGNTRLRA